MQAVFEGFCFRQRGRGALRSPAPPRVTGCERGAILSRSHGGCSGVDLGSRRCGLFSCGRCFRRRGRGALRSPTPPRVTGCERVTTLSRSPGAVLAWIWVPDDAGCSFVDAVSDGADVGRSASLRPPWAMGCERVHPLSRSPGAVLVGILVSDDAGSPYDGFVSDGAGVGRSAPLQPLG